MKPMESGIFVWGTGKIEKKKNQRRTLKSESFLENLKKQSHLLKPSKTQCHIKKLLDPFKV